MMATRRKRRGMMSTMRKKKDERRIKTRELTIMMKIRMKNKRALQREKKDRLTLAKTQVLTTNLRRSVLTIKAVTTRQPKAKSSF